MDAPDVRPNPFCAHGKPITVEMPGDEPAFVVMCPECGATGPKQLPGVPVEVGLTPGIGVAGCNDPLRAYSVV